MANEYAVNQADLLSVADAIRTKGKTTDPLSFPAEFVTAIENIKGSGGLSFEVVGGMTEPSNPAQSTIWVKTEQDVTEWTIRTSEPEQPGEGMVWIETAGTAERGVPLSNELYVDLWLAHQYQSGEWIVVDSAIYQDGLWNALGKFVLWDGTKLADGIEFDIDYNSNKGTLTINEEEGCLHLFIPALSSSQNAVFVTDTIDVTRYNSITCNTYIRGWAGGYFGLTANPSKLSYSSTPGSNAGVSGLSAQCRPITENNTEYTGTNTLDISKVTGLQYFVFGTGGTASGGGYTGEIKMYSVEFSV